MEPSESQEPGISHQLPRSEAFLIMETRMRQLKDRVAECDAENALLREELQAAKEFRKQSGNTEIPLARGSAESTSSVGNNGTLFSSGGKTQAALPSDYASEPRRTSGRARLSTQTNRFEPGDFRDEVTHRKRKTVEIDYGPTGVHCELLPFIFDKLVTRLTADEAKRVSITYVQHLIVQNALDDGQFPEGTELKLLDFCTEQVRANLNSASSVAAVRVKATLAAHQSSSGGHGISALDERASTGARESGMATAKAIEDALARYEVVMESVEMQKKREYRIENHTWTEDELQKFDEALVKIPHGATANQKIAEYIGGNVHANHVVYLKSQRRIKQRQIMSKAVEEIESDERAVPYTSYDYSHLAATKNFELKTVLKRKAKD